MARESAAINPSSVPVGGNVLRPSVSRTDIFDANMIAAARDRLDGPKTNDAGITQNGMANIAPLDSNGLAYSRSAGAVLNVVYLNPGVVTKGGFFPNGVNGPINTSDPNS